MIGLMSVERPTPLMTDFREMSDILAHDLAAAAEPTRLGILWLLRDGSRRTVNAIVAGAAHGAGQHLTPLEGSASSWRGGPQPARPARRLPPQPGADRADGDCGESFSLALGESGARLVLSR